MPDRNPKWDSSSSNNNNKKKHIAPSLTPPPGRCGIQSQGQSPLSLTRRPLSNNKNKNTDDMAAKNDDDDNSLTWLFTLVLPLQLVYIANQWSRSSIYYLVNFSTDDGGADPFRAMNVDIGFSEAQYGLLASLAFTTLFAVASLGAGAASDRTNRKTLTILSALGFGAATLGTSLSSSYTEVLSWRIFMGLACAFTTPTAYTLITQNVPKDRVAFATSLYGTGVAFGGALASLSIVLDNELGWKQAMQVISLVAFASAGICLLVLPDDTKKNTLVSETQAIPTTASDTDTKEASPFIEDVSQVVSSTRIKWLFLASFLRFCSGLCIGVWSAPYFKMTFPENAADYAVAQAVITALAGSASGLLGGAAADWLVTQLPDEEEDKIGIRLWVPVIGSVLAAPTWYLAVHSTDSFQTAMVWLSLEYFVAECWFGPTVSSLLGTVGPKVGGTAQGLFTMTGAVANLAPTLLGYLYGNTVGVESSSSSSSDLVTLLTYGVCFGYLSSAACFAISTQSSPTTTNMKKSKEA